MIVDSKPKTVVAKASILKHKHPSPTSSQPASNGGGGGLSPKNTTGNGNPDEYSNSSRQHLADPNLKNYVRVDKVSQENPDTEDGVVHGCITLAGTRPEIPSRKVL